MRGVGRGGTGGIVRITVEGDRHSAEMGGDEVEFNERYRVMGGSRG